MSDGAGTIARPVMHNKRYASSRKRESTLLARAIVVFAVLVSAVRIAGRAIAPHVFTVVGICLFASAAYVGLGLWAALCVGGLGTFVLEWRLADE